MIDIHAHILPGIDDGPSAWEESLELCRQLANQGVTGVVATPHFLPGQYPDPQQVLALVTELNTRLRSIPLALTVYPGAEAYLDPELPKQVAGGKVPTLNNLGQYLLVELPFDRIPSCAENVFFELLLAGITPILAHPERNAELQENPSFLATLVERGVLVQVNAGSITGEFGATVRRFTEKLIRQGLVHFIGSDAHHPHKRPPAMADALIRLNKLTDQSSARAISHENPEALLAGASVTVPDDNGPARREPAKRRFSIYHRKV